MDEREFSVWQRVQEGPRQEAMGEVLHRLGQRSRQALADYRLLGKRTASPLWGMPERWEKENLACIRGLFLLSAGRPLVRGGGQPQWEGTVDEIRLYRRALDQLREYTSLSAQPYFGTVLAEMARRQVRICEALVRILGDA